MEFRETLLAAQRNQQEKSSAKYYYKARFDPPKKEQKAKDQLSLNVKKFLAKKDEEERQKKIDAQRKRDELFAMRDSKALKKIQKTLKVIKSANKSVIADAIDRDHTALTREGPEQPGQDDYGYESQEAAALYEKMMQKYSKLPDEPKFPVANTSVSKDLNGTRERVRNALLHEDEPVPHKRRRKGEIADRELSPPTKYEPEKEKRKDEKPEKPKFRKPAAPPPMDFNQLLRLAEQKKCEPVDVAAAKKVASEPEPDRLMTKKQKREYEEEMARRQRRQERMDAEKSGNRKVQAEARSERQQVVDKERKSESGIGRIPKLSDKNSNNYKTDIPKTYEKEREKHVSDRDKIEKIQREKEKARAERTKQERERERLDREKFDRERLDREKFDRERLDREKFDRERLDREKLEKLKAERDRIDREMSRLNKDRDKLDKSKAKLENRSADRSVRTSEKIADRSKLSSGQPIKQDAKKSIDLKTQNTYRIDKNSNEKNVVAGKTSDNRVMDGYRPQGKSVPKLSKEQVLQQKTGMKDRIIPGKPKLSSEASQKLNGNVKLDNGKRLPENGKSLPSKRPDERRPLPGSGKSQTGPSKPKVSNSFDFDKHVNSLSKAKQFPPGDVKRKANLDDMKKKKRRMVESDSEYDSEMDDFIDDGDENMDYSKHIKEIFGYDKSKYRDMDDDDDPSMVSSFSRQQREEYISKKIGIMEDLEDMRMEAMEKKKSKRRRLSDD